MRFETRVSRNVDIRKRLKSLNLMILLFLFGTSCRLCQMGEPPQSVSPTQDAGHPLATAFAQVPAAGICGKAEGALVTVTILPDIPDPRCVIVGPDQVLAVVNKRGETLQVSLGRFHATLEADETYTIPAPLGDYLEPGVHRIEVAPCCGAEIWLQVDQ